MTRVSRLLSALLLAGAAIAAPAARAQQSGAPVLHVSALNTTAAAESGRPARTTVRPGDVLRYTLTFTNTSARPVSNVELRNPIPAGLRLVPASTHASRADARLEFSADNGATWAAQPMETVAAEGKTITRPIPADRYTHVRWTVRGAVAPRAVITADFEARVVGAGA